MHTRHRIVLAAVARLQPIGVAVKAGRSAPLPSAQAPYLLVYARREQSAPITNARKLQRQLELAVEVVTATAEDNDAEVDRLAMEVEKALAGDITLGGLCRDLWLGGSDLDARHEGETRIGRARFLFNVTYFTAAGAPEASL